LEGKHEGKIPLRKPTHRREDNIRMELREIVWAVMEWMHLAQDMDYWLAVVKRVMNFQVHKRREIS
jgi:ribosome biogenesis protein Nip4